MQYPNGWLVRMKQHFRSTPEYFARYRDQLEKTKESEVLYASFGNFDRVEFVPIRDFGDYRDRIVVDDSWYGKQQSVIIYAIGNDDFRLFLPSPEKGDVSKSDGRALMIMGGDGEPLPVGSRFLIHTMFYISEAAKSAVEDYQELLKLIRDRVLEITARYRDMKKDAYKKEHLECEVFGTFNSAEVAILWAADQFTDVLFLLDRLRYMRLELSDGSAEQVCVTTCTVISTNPSYSEKAADLVRGKAMVHLACAALLDKRAPGNFSIAKTREYIEGALRKAMGAGSEGGQEGTEVELSPCAEEFDYMVELPFRALRRIFPDRNGDTNDTFSAYEDEALPHIRRTSTCLFYRDRDVIDALKGTPDAGEWEKLLCIQLKRAGGDAETYDATPLDVMAYIGEGGFTYRVYQDIKAKLDRLTFSSGMRETFELLYRDYIETLCMATDHLWVKDYNKQFIAVLNILKTILDWLEHGDRVTKEEIKLFKERFQQVCEIMQQQASHIAESSKLFFEVPNSNIGYTAQFVLVYHAYYGIVKELIWHVYMEERRNRQRLLVPVINFTNTPVIESDLLDKECKEPGVEHLVSLRLPYDSWSNPLYYTPLLYHEIFHYVAPYNRMARNETYLVIAFSQVCMCLVRKSMDRYLRRVVKSEADESGVKLDKKEDLDRRVCKRTDAAVQAFQKAVFDAIGGERSNLFSILFNGKLPANCDYVDLRTALEELLESKGSADGKALFQNRCKILKKLCGLITASCSDSLKILEGLPDSQGIRDCRAYAEALSNGGAKMYDADVVRTLGLKMYDTALGAIHGLAEVYPDLAMIFGTKMGLIEYLVQFALLQKNCLNTPGVLEEQKELELRLGSIIDYLLKSGKLQDIKNENDFAKLYHVLLRHIESREHGEEACKRDRKEARDWFQFFARVYKNYKAEYGAFQVEMRRYIRVFEERNKFSEPLQELYGEVWNRLRGCGEDTNLSGEMFRWNIRLIHMFQRQRSLEKLQTLNRWEEPVPASPSST